MIASGPGSRKVAGQPEGRRTHQGAEPDLAGLQREAGQRQPGIGRAGLPGSLPYPQVVVGTEESVVTGILRGPRNPQQIVVGGALLRLGEDPEVHDSSG
jgi:hypothetical protein